MPGRYSAFSRRSLMSAATSSRRAQIDTSLPASASTIENAVPHEPAPRTATFWSFIRRSSVAGSGAGGGCRSRRPPASAGRSAATGAFSPRTSSTSAVRAAMIRSVASRVVSEPCCPAAALARRSSSSTGSPTFIVIRLRGNRSGSLRVRRQQLVRAPLPDRDHRAAGGQGDARRAGLAGHRPQVGIAGERALGVDHHALAGLDGGHGGVVGAHRLLARPEDRDLARRAQEPAQQPCS